MAKKAVRKLPETLQIAGLSEYYYDQLTIEAYLKGRSLRMEAQSLLGAILYRRRDDRAKMLAELARKRDITVEEMIDMILMGVAEEMSPDEYAASISDEDD